MFANIWYLSANRLLTRSEGKKTKATKVIEDIAKNVEGLQIGFPRFELCWWGRFRCVKNNAISPAMSGSAIACRGFCED